MCYAWEKKIEALTRLVCLVTQVRIQMKQFITGEIFSEKGTTFQAIIPLFRKKVTSSKVLPFLRFNRKDQIFCTICVDYQCKASSQGKKITIVLSEVQCTIPYKVLYPLVEVVSRKSRVNFCIKFTVLHTIHLFYLLL